MIAAKKEMYYVMQRLGVSLTAIITQNLIRHSYQQVIALGCQLLTSLENLHDLGYIHCDIKTDNILFGRPTKHKNIKDKPKGS